MTVPVRSAGIFPVTMLVALGAASAIGVAGWASRSVIPRPQDQETEQVRWTGTVRHPELCEVSGLACSPGFPGHFWMHNDSGHPAEAWLVAENGEPRARFRLDGAEHRDWEDIACFRLKGQAWVMLADVGDNGASREACQLYLFREPQAELAEGKLLEEVVADARRIDFVYSDGPRNCEAAGVDPVTGEVRLIEKLDGRADAAMMAGIYSVSLGADLEAVTSATEPLRAERIGETPVRLITALDIAPDGRRLVCRNYFQYFVIDRGESQSWADAFRMAAWTPATLPVEFQGEAIALAPDGQSIFTASEFTSQPIWQVQLNAGR